MDHKAEVDFGFASFSDRTFELIARDIKTGKEITLYGTLRPEQTIDQIDQVLPTCVYVRGATISRLTAEQAVLQNTIDVLESNARVQAKLLADTGRERDGLRRALQASTDRVQRFLDTFGDLGDCVTQADVSDWREVLATPTDPDAESRGQD